MSNLGASTEIMEELNAPTVPSLFQLALSWISNQSLWSFAQDIPETAVPGLLKKIRHTDFDLDLLPNLLPPSLQHLDLTGYYTLTEDTLLAIIKKCFSITELILNDVPLITQHVVPQIFWYLPDLTYLSLGAGVGSLAMLEMVKKPIQLRYLAINSASMDEMWLEQLRYFPDLITLKLRNVIVPKIQSVPFKLPPHLASVNISTSSNQKLSVEHVNLFTYFLTNVPSLQEFVIYYRDANCLALEIGPIIAKDLRVLRAKSVKVSNTVAAAIDDTCQNLQEVSGLFLYESPTESKRIGQRTIGVGDTVFTYTNKKLTFDYTTITSADMAWNEGPTSFVAPKISIFVFPLDPCYALKTLVVSTKVDLVEILELFPNLEDLVLVGCQIVLDKKQKDPTQILGSRLKVLHLSCDLLVPEGAIDLLSHSKVLKNVTLQVSSIHEFNKKKLHLDNILKRFPFVEKLKITSTLASRTIINGDNKKWMDPDLKAIITDHPLRELSIKYYRGLNENTNLGIKLKNIDFNQYKNLQVLEFYTVHLKYGVKLPSRLRVLEGDDVKSIHESTEIPLNLYHLRWKSNLAFSRIIETMKQMKYLRSVQLSDELWKKAKEIYNDEIQHGYPPKLKYILPRRSEISKTNLLSAFSGIKKEMSPMEKLPALLQSSGSNLTMKEVQLIAEMYSKQEISLHSDQPVVRVRIRLTSGAVMNIQCNPTHRVIDLYAYARHAVKLGDKAFDLVVPPRTILDLSTYDKTVKELGLTNTTLIQKLREATPVENELRSYSLFHSQIVNFGKDKSDGLGSSQDQSIKKSNTSTVNNTNNVAPNKDEISMDESEDSYDSVSDDEEQDNMSGDDDDSDDMQMSDDDDDLDMYYGAEKVEKKEEITAENKYLLDQMNANMMRQSRDYHEQKEREEREEARLKYEAEQKKIEEERERMRQFLGRAAPRYNNPGYVPFDYQINPNPPPQPQPQQQPINFVPAQQPNPLNAGFMTDEEMARMLQEEEYLNNFD